MTSFTRSVGVVTGAAAGMGRSLAIELARRGARVAICDIDSAGLAETARLCRLHGADVESAIVDVVEHDQMRAFADTVLTRFGTVNYLFNNAGVGYAGTVEHSSIKDIERIMDIDFWGVVHGTKIFLPHLIDSGDGHIANTSSIFGLFAAPTQSAYNAAKFAVRGFTESLRQEMLAAEHPVTVSSVHPGGVRTDIARNMTMADGAGRPDNLVRFFDRFAITTPDRAARTIIDGTAAGKAKILVGPDAHLANLGIRIVDIRYQRLVTFLATKVSNDWL